MAAQQHGDKRARQVGDGSGETGTGLVEHDRGDAVHRAQRAQNVVAGKLVMRRRDHQIEFGDGDVGILHLHAKGPSPAGALDRKRRRDRSAAGADQQARPGRRQRVAGCRQHVQARRRHGGRQPAPGRGERDLFFRRCDTQDRGQTAALVDHTEPAVGNDPGFG